MDEMLYKAAMEGNTELLLKLIQEKPLILDRVNSITTDLETPLHIAAMLGHEGFVAELLRRKPGLAHEVDSTRSTALHLASAKGHVEIVKALLRVHADMCVVCDRDGRNPLHVAAMMGRVDVLKEMLKVKPDAARVEMKHNGGNILHLCVEYCQFEALKIILEKEEFKDLVNSKDRNGNTILHLAVADKQVETIEFLQSVPGMDLNAVNLSGMTAMDVLIQRGKDVRDLEMEKFLKRAGATGGKRNIAPFHQNKDNHDCLCSCKNSKKQTKNKEEWIEKKRNALMVVASLIATMAFQAGVSPPEKVWESPTAGFNLLGLGTVKGFFVSNTLSFIASLSIVLLLMSGLPLKSRFFVWILLIITWIAISGVAGSYAGAVILQTPRENENSTFDVVGYTVVAWNCLMTILLLLHTIRLLWRMVKKFWKMIKLLMKCFFKMFKLLTKCLCGGKGSSASARHGNNSRV